MAVRFRGQSEHVLDGKGRMIFPGRYRDSLEQNGSMILIIAPWNNHLRAFPMDVWEAFEDKVMEQMNDRRVQDFVRKCIGRAVECPVDKQGRILLPANLRSAVGLDKDVVLTGMLRWVEIWDKSTSESLLDSDDQSGFEETENAAMALVGAF